MTVATILIPIAPEKVKSNGEVKHEKVKIDFQQLAFCDEAVSYLYKFFLTPDIWNNLCDDDKNGAFLFDVTDGMRNGRNIMWVPMINGDPCGLLYGYFMNGGLFEGHFGIFEKHRKHGVQIVREGIEQFFEVTKAHSIVGIIPIWNKRAVYCAMMAGFHIAHKLDNYFKKNGKLEPTYMLIKENNNG